MARILVNGVRGVAGDRHTEVGLDGVAEIVIDHAAMLHHQSRHPVHIQVEPVHQFGWRQALGNRREIVQVGEQDAGVQQPRLQPAAFEKLLARAPHLLGHVGRYLLGENVHQVTPLAAFQARQISNRQAGADNAH